MPAANFTGVVGIPDSLSWTQFWEAIPPHFSLEKSHGRLYALLTLSLDKQEEDSDLTPLGKELITFLNEKFFSSPTPPDLASHLEQTIKEISEEQPIFTKIDPKIDLIVFILLSDKIIISRSSESSAYLLRQNQLAPLFSPDQKTVTGPLQPSDRFFLFSPALESLLGPDQISKLLSSSDQEALKEKVSLQIHSAPDQSPLGLLIVSPTPPSTSSSEELSLSSSPSPSLPSSSFLSRLQKRLPHLPFSPPSLSLAHYEPGALSRRRRLSALLGLSFLVFLSVSIFFGSRHRQAQDQENRFQTIKAETEEKINQAKSLQNLDLESSLQIAREADLLLKDLDSFSLWPEDVAVLRQTIDLLLSQSGEKGKTQAQPFYDLGLIAADLSPSQIFWEKDNLYLLSPGQHRLDLLNTVGKSTQIVSSAEEISQAKSFCATNNHFYILTPDGIFDLSKTEAKKVIDKEDLPENPLTLSGWNGSLYLLDSTPTIWKYSPTATGFATRQNWLVSGKINFENPISLAINGSIWVLGQLGELQPYLRGQPDSFNPQPLKVSAPAFSLTTGPDTKLISFADSDNNIFVFTKDSQLKAQYNLGTPAKVTATAIAVDETQNRLFILGDDHQLYTLAI